MLWDALPKEDSHLCLIATRQLSAIAGEQVCGISADEIASCTDARRPRESDS